MKYQRKVIKFIFGLVLVCAIIYPVLGLDLGVNVISLDLQIVSTNPSETSEIYVDDVQPISIILDRNVTAIWYENNTEIRTDYNVSNSSYYFTSSTIGDYNITVFCTDSLINTSQVNYTWIVSVISAVEPQPTPPRANIPVYPHITPVETVVPEDIIDEEEIEEPKRWYIPDILITYLNLWEESTRPQIINTAIEILETTEWKFPEYQKPEFHVPEYDFPEFPEFHLPELQLSEYKMPEELSVLNNVDKTLMRLGIVFLLLFLISLKGGSGGRISNPGRKSPIKR